MDEVRPEKKVRRVDPERTKRDILREARIEFAEKGFAGARVDQIGARTATAKRMIYYHFGSKEGLYVAVLEEAYKGIRDLEKTLSLDHLDPDDALCRLIDFTFDYERANLDFVRLISVENLNQARYLKGSKQIRETNSNVIEELRKLMSRGYADGTFVRKEAPENIHFMISGLCFYRVSNKHTFSAIFGVDLDDEKLTVNHKAMIRNTIRSYLRTTEFHG